MLPSKRPETWNAKMVLSGKPLITDQQFEQLLLSKRIRSDHRSA
jgi:hypothetical protein